MDTFIARQRPTKNLFHHVSVHFDYLAVRNFYDMVTIDIHTPYGQFTSRSLCFSFAEHRFMEAPGTAILLAQIPSANTLPMQHIAATLYGFTAT